MITGFDPRDWSAMPTPTTSFLTGLDDGVAGLRIAYSPDLGFVRNDPEVEPRSARRSASSRARAPRSTRSTPGFSDPVDAFHVLWFSGAAQVLSAYGRSTMRAGRPRTAPDRRGRVAYSAADYLDATAGGWNSAC